MRPIVPAVLEKLYKFDSVRTAKEYLRPFKQKMFGKSGIYHWLGILETVLVDKPITIFDIGAAVGDVSRTFLNTFPYSTVYAFEPFSLSYEKLTSRTQQFNDRIKRYNQGFYNETMEKDLNVASYHDASSLLPLTGCENKSIEKVYSESVKLEKLDDFVRNNSITYIDLCKIDVEGVEKEVIEGGIDTFREKVSSIIVEISNLKKGQYNDSHIKVFQYLHDLGFTFLGCDEDYFFSKDPRILAKFFK